MNKEQKKHFEQVIKEAKEEVSIYKSSAPESKSLSFWAGYLNALQDLKHDLKALEG